jgi:hypothetical protein
MYSEWFLRGADSGIRRIEQDIFLAIEYLEGYCVKTRERGTLIELINKGSIVIFLDNEMKVFPLIDKQLAITLPNKGQIKYTCSITEFLDEIKNSTVKSARKI